jgi:predicted ATP-grasp superfamily ATP-dependent carboligase
MDRTRAVLIAAVSGRALAASARRGGHAPLVADFFGDQDTLAAAQSHIRFESPLANGIDGAELLAAFERLSAGQEAIGVVCGTGFEAQPDLLAALGQRWTLFGNDADMVARLTDPLELAALCRACEIPHPETSTSPPADSRDWLAKRRGGAGGQHICPAHAFDAEDADAGSFYFQRHVAGTPVSALVLAAAGRGLVLGFSDQWPNPTPGKPFRYGGAVRPAALTHETTAALTDAVRRLVARLPLAGLNSFDFLVGGRDFCLLEINPRPGATLDLFEPADGSLFALHLAACRGRLPERAPICVGARAAAVVYAERDIPAFPAVDWPAWTADRPHPGIPFKAGEPLCTVLASAATAAEAKDAAHSRTATILAGVAARPS